MTGAGPEVLSADGLARRYHYRDVFRDVSLALSRGRCLLLRGANGAGKTSLLEVLAGLARPARGTVRLREVPVADWGPAQRRAVAYLPHQPPAYRGLTASENCVFFGRLYGGEAVETRTAALLERVGLAAHRDRPVRQFSRGMLQRYGLALALLFGPAVLLLDEPFTALDPDGCETLRGLLAEEKARGTALLLVSHQGELVGGLADGALRLEGGALTEEGA